MLASGAQAEGYKPKGLLTTGYFEHREQDGTWFVGANSRAQGGFAAAERIALYRAAALARDQGHRYVQLLRIRTQRLSMRNGPELSENTHLEVRFADSPAAPADCRQPTKYRDQCRTLDGVQILALYAKDMGQEPPVLPPDLQPPPVPPGYRETSTLVRFTVDTTGRPFDCVVVESNAPPMLSASSCALMISRARYSPAMGPDGKPIAKIQTMRFRWRIPDSNAPQPPVSIAVAQSKPVPAKPAPIAAPPRKVYPHDDTVQTPL